MGLRTKFNPLGGKSNDKEIYTKGQVILEKKTAGNFSVNIGQPKGIYKVTLFGAGGGGGTAQSWPSTSSSDNRGAVTEASGGGGAFVQCLLELKGNTYTGTVGAAGTGGTATVTNGSDVTVQTTDGGNSNFSNYVVCNGGEAYTPTAGYTSSTYNVASGGSGGTASVNNAYRIFNQYSGRSGSKSGARNTSKTGSLTWSNVSTSHYGYGSSRSNGYFRIEYCGLPKQLSKKYIYIIELGNTSPSLVPTVWSPYTQEEGVVEYRTSTGSYSQGVIKVVFKGYNSLTYSGKVDSTSSSYYMRSSKLDYTTNAIGWFGSDYYVNIAADKNYHDVTYTGISEDEEHWFYVGGTSGTKYFKIDLNQ